MKVDLKAPGIPNTNPDNVVMLRLKEKLGDLHEPKVVEDTLSNKNNDIMSEDTRRRLADIVHNFQSLLQLRRRKSSLRQQLVHRYQMAAKPAARLIGVHIDIRTDHE